MSISICRTVTAMPNEPAVDRAGDVLTVQTVQPVQTVQINDIPTREYIDGLHSSLVQSAADNSSLTQLCLDKDLYCATLELELHRIRMKNSYFEHFFKE